ncbi:MAG: CD225/dispanin family protein [Opitutales bacterium]|nr:CD225/dispanin family protein [Opitutales bacterium]MBQ2721801.1 CD225/dispanin family protein [Opitutales bacterium]MBR7106142.1 CD225/dispanin family protein [Opitutales bacterium]
MADKNKRVSKTLIFGILATIFCCPPLGVISIIYSGKYETYTALDNPAKAMMAKEKARFWAIWAMIVGLVIGIGTWIFY